MMKKLMEFGNFSDHRFRWYNTQFDSMTVEYRFRTIKVLRKLEVELAGMFFS